MEATQEINTGLLFDTLKYTKQATAVGYSQPQAEFQAEKMAELIGETLVTKNYFQRELASLESNLRHELGLSESRTAHLLYKMTGIIVGGIPSVLLLFGSLYHVIWNN